LPARGGQAFGPDDFRAWTGVSRETLDRLKQYAGLLGKWQRAINLVSPDTLPDLWYRHMLDSAQLWPLLPEECRVLVDLGSGAGFPGLVLAIMGVPKVHLVEADARKATFLREAARIAVPHDSAVVVHARRLEALQPFAVDAITSRGLAPLSVLLRYAVDFIGPSTVCIFPKGAKAEEELTEAAKDWRMRVERVPSITDPAATIFRVSEIVRGSGQPAQQPTA
jgi:16S rRNA (guanine527-N7)-methyltransferase